MVGILGEEEDAIGSGKGGGSERHGPSFGRLKCEVQFVGTLLEVAANLVGEALGEEPELQLDLLFLTQGTPPSRRGPVSILCH